MMTSIQNCVRVVSVGVLAMTFMGSSGPAVLADDAPAGAENPPARADARKEDRAPGQQSGASEPKADALIGPNAVDKLMKEDAKPKPFLFDLDGFSPLQAERDAFFERTGLRFGADYNTLYFVATDSLGDDTSGSGVLRLFVKWDLVGRRTKDTGSLVVKGGNRHSYTDIPPSSFAPELGWAGALNLSHSDQGWRTTNLYWRQLLFGGRFISYIGFIDVTDYTDVYPLTSYYTTFSNLVFGTGSGTVGGLPDGALGTMAGFWLTDDFYAVGGLADAESDPPDVFNGFETFFDDFHTFKSFEVGWSPTKETFWANNIHVMFYQIDEVDTVGTSDGWGVSVSGAAQIGDAWQVFLRGGWGDDGGSPLEGSISTGFGYQRIPGGDLFALGLNWGRPNSDTYGVGDLDDQFTSEIFYRCQVTRNLQLTPSVQLLGNPALNPDTDMIAVFGIRSRLAF